MNVKKNCVLITLALSVAFAHAHEVTLDFSYVDGRTRRERVSLDADNRLVLTADRIGAGVRTLDVAPEFATAKKGEDGYFLMPDGLYGTYREENGEFFPDARNYHPIFIMKTPRVNFMAHATGLAYSYETHAVATNGEYRLFNRYNLNGDRPCEDLVVSFSFGDLEKTWCAFAREYRACQLGRGACRPIAERMKESPALAYAATNIEVRLRLGWKPVPAKVKDQTPFNEPPVKVAITFDRCRDIMREFKRQGIPEAEFCLVGWNKGGHDGAYPQIFPVEPKMGGEAKLRALLKDAKAMGFQTVAHNNYSDAYLIADCFDEEFTLKNKDGSIRTAGTWGGGFQYLTCPQRMCERFLVKDLEMIRFLGFYGLHYIDVISSQPLRKCYDPRHAIDENGCMKWYSRIQSESKRRLGGFASEGIFDYCVGDLDYCLYGYFYKLVPGEIPKMMDRHVPLAQIIYNGIVLINPFCGTVNYTIKDNVKRLKIVEFGGRPIFYFYTNFVEGFRWMGDEDLTCATDDELRKSVASVKKGYDEFRSLSDLQFVFMDEHEYLTPDVTCTTYANGTKVVVNHGAEDYDFNGAKVPAGDWRRFDECQAAVRSQCESTVPILEGWRFSRGDAVGAESPSFDDSSWEIVRIPHDWAIGGHFSETNDIQVTAIEQDGETAKKRHSGRTGGLPWPGVGWYRCRIELPADAESAELVFDGAMANPVVYADGEKVGEWRNGYTPFAVRLPAKRSMTIAVRIENHPASSRWYPGSGIYRPVALRVNCRHRPEDVFVRTERIEDGKAFMRVSSPDGERAFTVDNPKLWTPETPYLYTLEPEGIRYGIRTITWTNGVFELNGKRRKFRGACLHHDLGPLGAAFNVAAFRRQVRLLKEMGCDSIRTAHNIPCSWQMDVCDEEGMMVMAESLDEWRKRKCENGYHRVFDDWWRKDLDALVRFHRNHPSIVMWSIGNEIPDQGSAEGTALSKAMVALVHSLDPTRPVTQGHSRMPDAIKAGGPQAMDIPGVTYRLPFYGALREASRYGGVLGAETASTVSSRGVYKFPAETTVERCWDDGQCSSYDLGQCDWSNLPDDDFAMQDDNPWTLGEFVWTGFDYLGEPTPYKEYWPSRSSYFGIFDLAGIPKDRYWLYRARWNKSSPTLHILPHWTWPGREGQVTPVYCYTSWPTAELFVNGKSQGLRTKDKSSRLDRYRLRWNDVVYEPGELKVVAYDAQGRRAGEDVVRTAGEPCRIEVSADRVTLEPPSGLTTPDLAFVTANIVDRDGNLCPDADALLDFKASGSVKFKAVCNGDATSTERFVDPSMKAFHGRIVAVVEASAIGEGSLAVSSAGLESAKVVFSVTPRNCQRMEKTIE